MSLWICVLLHRPLDLGDETLTLGTFRSWGRDRGRVCKARQGGYAE